jgi:peptidoglycan/xylan/chitin deacetylase (PgdA/CDA1 family)
MLKESLPIAVFLMFLCPALADVGDTTITKWKDNKKGAFTMLFDDSTVTQAVNAMPAMVERGLAGTWYVNPGLSRYKNHKEVWEETCPETGQELADHTMTHGSARNYEQAEYEIGECAKIIWGIRERHDPDATRLLSCSTGGGTTWTISSAEKAEIYAKYNCISNRHSSTSIKDSNYNSQYSVAQGALSSGDWKAIHYHAIGSDPSYGASLTVSKERFIDFLDYLVPLKDELWVTTTLSARMYQDERDTASISVLEATNDQIRIRLTSSKDSAFYNEPLTLITDVADDWDSCEVLQDGKARPCSVENGGAMYEAVPGSGEIVLSQEGGGAPGIPGDVTGDGKVDIFDLVLVAQNFGKTSGFDSRADANDDGKVDIFDLVIVAQNFGRGG